MGPSASWKRMFSRLKWTRAAPRSSRAGGPAVPDGAMVYAIGDVHGRHDLLIDLLDRIADDAAAHPGAEVSLVLLGDLVDRGPESGAVIELCATRDWGDWRPRFLLGNHEEMMLGALGGDLEAARHWLRNGGRETMLSYGVNEAALSGSTTDRLVDRFAALVPPHHIAFLRAMEDHVVVGDYWFVHAGVRPGVPLERQKPSDLRWIRREFLESSADFGGFVVHGHTITSEPEVMANRIGIDTGAYATGRLTALALAGERRWIIQAEGARG